MKKINANKQGLCEISVVIIDLLLSFIRERCSAWSFLPDQKISSHPSLIVETCRIAEHVDRGEEEGNNRRRRGIRDTPVNVFGFRSHVTALLLCSSLIPIHVYSPGHEFTARTVIELAGHDFFHCPRKTFRFAISPCLTAALSFQAIQIEEIHSVESARVQTFLSYQLHRPRNGIPCSNPNSSLSSRETLKIYYRSHTDRVSTCMEITSVFHELMKQTRLFRMLHRFRISERRYREILPIESPSRAIFFKG